MPSFNEITAENAAEYCPLFFERLTTIPDLQSAASLTGSFRKHLSYGSYAKGFIIDAEVVRDILSQNGGNISGLRIYLGIDETVHPHTFIGIVVATELVDHEHHDFGIPEYKTDPCNVIFGEARPCPIHCGRNNALNT